MAANHKGELAAMRRSARAARAAMHPEQRASASAKIADTVVRSPWFRRSRYIGCYLPMPDEVDTWPLIGRAWRMKKRIFVPVIEKKFVMRFRELTADSDLRVNKFGIFEPECGASIETRALDIVITPVVAFDKKHHRLGMGGGYYDRAFSFLKDRKQLFHPKLIGVAFSCQQVEKIVPNPWDIRIFRLIDESS